MQLASWLAFVKGLSRRTIKEPRPLWGWVGARADSFPQLPRSLFLATWMPWSLAHSESPPGSSHCWLMFVGPVLWLKAW